MNSLPLVSIIIRAKNEGKSLLGLLPLLYSQKTDFLFEILLFDNSSQDKTLTIAKNYPNLKVVTIENHQFHFSKSLNDAAKIAQGKILIHLSAHCFPCSHFWLQSLVQPLIDDSSLIAVYGRQFSDPNVNVYEQRDWEELLFPKNGEPKIKTFSNANGAVRKSYLLAHPFDEQIPLLEDNFWYQQLPDKTKIIYIAQAEVLHLHPLFNLKYYIPRWQKEGQTAFYIEKIKNSFSPLASVEEFSRTLSIRRILSFFKTGLELVKQGLILYGLAAPIFYTIRDYCWKKGLRKGQKQFNISSQHQYA